MSGRARDGRLVHFRPGPEADIRPGDLVTVDITSAAPHHLIADGHLHSHRRTRAGDAHELGIMPKTAPIGVGLGLPSIGAPVTVPAAATSGCCE
jgi:tRNA-2-methylthio-N6-dimethylallyladenosine synthase